MACEKLWAHLPAPNWPSNVGDHDDQTMDALFSDKAIWTQPGPGRNHGCATGIWWEEHRDILGIWLSTIRWSENGRSSPNPRILKKKWGNSINQWMESGTPFSDNPSEFWWSEQLSLKIEIFENWFKATTDLKTVDEDVFYYYSECGILRYSRRWIPVCT